MHFAADFSGWTVYRSANRSSATTPRSPMFGVNYFFASTTTVSLGREF
jgi:hypothetical protein